MQGSKLFVYGTLVPRDWMAQISNQYAENEWDGETFEATLLDHKLLENGFKCVTPSSGDTVTGVIHTNLGREHFLGLDQYEGDPWLYTRTAAKAVLADGTLVDCFVYLGNSILKGARVYGNGTQE